MGTYDEKYFKPNSDMKHNRIEDLITADEQILWRGKPKKSAFLWGSICKMMPLALVWLLFDGAFLAIMITNNIFAEMPPVFIVALCVFFAFHLLPVWLWLKNVLTANHAHKNLEYAVTQKRVLIRSGIIGIDVQSIYYADIESVNLKVGIIDRILKVGDIYLTGKVKAQVLWDIENPYDTVRFLQEVVHDMKTDTFYPNAYRPDANEGYPTKYEKK